MAPPGSCLWGCAVPWVWTGRRQPRWALKFSGLPSSLPDSPPPASGPSPMAQAAVVSCLGGTGCPCKAGAHRGPSSTSAGPPLGCRSNVRFSRKTRSKGHTARGPGDGPQHRTGCRGAAWPGDRWVTSGAPLHLPPARVGLKSWVEGSFCRSRVRPHNAKLSNVSTRPSASETPWFPGTLPRKSQDAGGSANSLAPAFSPLSAACGTGGTLRVSASK